LNLKHQQAYETSLLMSYTMLFNEDLKQGIEVKPITDDGIDQPLQRVYEKIEKEALATYHSNLITTPPKNVHLTNLEAATICN